MSRGAETMFELTVQRPGEAALRATLDNGAYLIGSGAECPIRLDAPGVASRHAQLILQASTISKN